MITIAFDEYGDFEKVSNGYEPVMIGGFLYDDQGDDADTANEKKRIISWLEAVCISKGCRFPKDLHCDGKSNNGAAVRRAKEKYDNTAAEFFRTGTFDGKPLKIEGKELPKRKGRYCFFAIIRSKTGKIELLGEKTAKLVKDSYAANLYINMAQDIVSKVLFHNPFVARVDKVALLLPTRLGVAEGEGKKRQEFAELGYVERKEKETDCASCEASGRIETHSSAKKYYGEEDKRRYPIVSTDLYRSAISREMLRMQKQNMEIVSFNVKSFTNAFRNKNNPAIAKHAFVFLTDVVNSALVNKKSISDPVEWMNHIQKKTSLFTNDDRNLLYAYTGVDHYFSAAWESFEKKDYYEALQQAYEGSVCKDEFTEFYKKKWFSYLENAVIESKNTTALQEAIQKTQKSTYASNLNQEKLLYIFHTLEKAALKLNKNSFQERKTLYELYDAGVSAFNHIGHFQKAEEYYQNCLRYANEVDLEQFLRTKNKQVVFLTDRFSFEEAQLIAEENISLHKKLQELQDEVVPEEKKGKGHGLAIAYSQLGQVYAFALDQRAEECYQKALSMLDDTSADYYITLSYLLHWYIESGQMDAYEEWMKRYTNGKETCIDQLKYLLKTAEDGSNSLISLKFGIYVFAKGLYTFYQDAYDEEMQDYLFQLRDNLRIADENAEEQYVGHPWEITNKYLAMIALRCGKKSDAERLMREAKEQVKIQDYTVKAISLYGEMEFERAKDPKAELSKQMNELWEQMVQCHLADPGMPKEQREEYLEKRFAYMYH